MIRLQITPAAFEAIVAMLPGNVGFENKRASNGDYFIWLDHAAVAKLKVRARPWRERTATRSFGWRGESGIDEARAGRRAARSGHFDELNRESGGGEGS